MQFAVGFKIQGKTGHVVVDAEDALIAALKVKMQRPVMSASKTNEATPVTLCADLVARVLSFRPPLRRPDRLRGTFYDLYSQ